MGDAMSALTFEICIYWPGWVRIDLASGGQHVSADCSNCRDTLGDLIRGLAQLVDSPGKFEIVGDTENHGITLLAFRRTNEDLEITAKREGGLGKITSAHHRRARIRHRGPWPRDLRQIATAIQTLLIGNGVAARYEANWGHPFPGVEFAKITADTD
ncbi:MAG: hypothetical protein H6816_13220 [Phycisphaerales bacterium]|nr:hypothetical protein [Phycisphaerales bacterium]